MFHENVAIDQQQEAQRSPHAISLASNPKHSSKVKYVKVIL
jgi:hypothetical protein